MNEALLKRWFKIFCIAEFISCFLLFCVAMPLKYGYGNTAIMFPVGLFHGVAFMGYVVLALLVQKYYKWDLEELIFVMIFAFVPFMTLLVHRKVEKFEKENPA